MVARFGVDLAQLVDVAHDQVLIALSGGPDSVALLLLAHALLGDRCGAATVDHGLRPAAAAEADFAAGLCAARGIAHSILRGPLPDRAGRSANLSARARGLRYRLLAEEAARRGGWVVTGHHADDQLETAVMRMNRGTGVAGLAGIRPSGWRVVRPLLGWRRAELADIVAAAGIVAVADPSNADDRFARARVRKALGAAEWLDPAGFATSAAALAEADEALTWSTQRLLVERVTEVGDAVVLDPTGVPAELIRRLVRACVVRIDPTATPDGPSYGRLIAALLAGRSATIAGVLATPGISWRFCRAPPRRNG